MSDDPLTAPADSGWRLVARGVEDLQVQYRRGNPLAWQPTPGIVDPNGADFTTIVREVRVMLGARTVQGNIQGARTSADGGDFVRGQLQSIIAPRAWQFYLAKDDEFN